MVLESESVSFAGYLAGLQGRFLRLGYAEFFALSSAAYVYMAASFFMFLLQFGFCGFAVCVLALVVSAIWQFFCLCWSALGVGFLLYQCPLYVCFCCFGRKWFVLLAHSRRE